MKRNGGGYYSLFFISTITVLLAVINQVHGAPEDIWLYRSLSSETVNSNISAAEVQQTPGCYNSTVPAYGIKNSQVTPAVVQLSGCWLQTDNGSIEGIAGGIKYLRVGPAGSVAMNDSSYGDYRLAGSKVVVQYKDYTISIYDQPELSGQIKGYNTDAYFLLDKTEGTRWGASYSGAGGLIAFYYYNLSNNGKWLVGRTNEGFARLNLETKEVLTFDSQTSRGYGYQNDPYYSMAISNDGRHVAWRESDRLGYDARIYDLAVCSSASTSGRTIATGCGRRDIKAQVSNNGSVDTITRLYFDEQGKVLTYFAHTGQQWLKKALVSGSVTRYDYVALGDSYSSGEGAFSGSLTYRRGTDRHGELYQESNTGITGYPYDEEICHQSITSYPYRLMADAGTATSFGDVSCSGADINDVLNTKTDYQDDYAYNGSFDQLKQLKNNNYIKVIKDTAVYNLFPGRAAQIEVIARHQPRVVTIGVGGNNIDFAGKLMNCIAAPFATCSYANNLRYNSGVEIRSMHKKYLELFRRLKLASPATRFYAVGYPQFLSLQSLSPTESCAPNVSLDIYERQFVIASVNYLNTVIKSAAQQSGITYLDIEGSLQGKALCDDNLPGDKAVNGIDNGNDQYNVIGNESFHPTDIGHKMIYDTISTRLGGQTILNFDACSGIGTALCVSQPTTTPPAVPSYFTDGHATSSQTTETYASEFITNISTSFANGFAKTSKMILDTTRATMSFVTDAVTVPQTVFAPGSSVSATIHSQPKHLGSYTVDQNGNIYAEITLPADLPYGPHVIVLQGTSPDGNELILYKNIYVYATETDLDGDGVANKDEPCLAVTPSHLDADRDGIDDACDGIIDETRDTTPPVVTAHVDVQPNDKGWYARDVTIHWTANDDTDTTIAPLADTTADQEGEYMYTSPQVCDAAGNCATGSITIKLDKTAPVVTAEMGRPANDNGWYADDVTISWGATDNVALQLTPPVPSIVTTEGEHTYTSAQVCDDAGNCSTGSQSVKLDKTLPMMGELSWDKNPKKSTEVSHLTVPVTDAGSGIARVEYFIGDTDPGLGNGAMMHYDGTSARVDQTTDFATGVYKISVRAQDAAGNWSQISSGYLVAYDPTPGVKVRGRRTIKIVPGYAVNLPWVTSPTNATFGFSVKYAADGTIAKQSDLQFSYKTGSNCHRPARAINCHVFELNASSIKWLTVGGRNNSVATFEAAAKLRQDNIIQTVSVVLRVTDGNRINRFTEDDFMISIYQPTSMVFGTPDMWAGPLPVKRGNINIIDFIYKTN